MKHKLESRFPGEISITSDMQMTPQLTAESEEELKSFLMKVKEESEKVGLKLNIQKMKIMASSPITSWQIDGETVEIVADFILGGSKITADGDCSHEMKRLSPWLFVSLLFTAICKASPDSHFTFLHFFSMGMVLIPVSCTMSRTSELIKRQRHYFVNKSPSSQGYGFSSSCVWM